MAAHITVAGEQAEAFDQQMDVDREWFDTHPGVLFIRPQLPGEFNEQQALGYPVPAAGPVGPDGAPDFLMEEAVWTAVVDLGRLWRLAVQRRPPGPPTGCRTRLKVVPPLTHAARRDTAAMVISYALNVAAYLRTKPEPAATVSMQQQQGRRPRTHLGF